MLRHEPGQIMKSLAQMKLTRHTRRAASTGGWSRGHPSPAARPGWCSCELQAHRGMIDEDWKYSLTENLPPPGRWSIELWPLTRWSY